MLLLLPFYLFGQDNNFFEASFGIRLYDTKVFVMSQELGPIPDNILIGGDVTYCVNLEKRKDYFKNIYLSFGGSFFTHLPGNAGEYEMIPDSLDPELRRDCKSGDVRVGLRYLMPIPIIKPFLEANISYSVNSTVQEWVSDSADREQIDNITSYGSNGFGNSIGGGLLIDINRFLIITKCLFRNEFSEKASLGFSGISLTGGIGYRF
jgi:hypothetical protein